MDTNKRGRVMVDLETLGNRAGCPIAAIGAVKFGCDIEGVDVFYARVDLRSCERAGLRPDMDTILWWLRQAPEAQREMTDTTGRKPLVEVLREFTVWCGPVSELWGNGASFDPPILGAA